MTRAIDCLVNVDMGDAEPPDWMIRVKEDTFKAGASFLRSPELEELIDDMDANGVERAILLTRLGKSADRAQRYVERRPERFSLGVGGMNLLRPMPSLKALESFVPRKLDPDHTNLSWPMPAWMHALLHAIFAAELPFTRRFDWPAGHSIACIARKPGGSARPAR